MFKEKGVTSANFLRKILEESKREERREEIGVEEKRGRETKGIGERRREAGCSVSEACG